MSIVHDLVKRVMRAEVVADHCREELRRRFGFNDQQIAAMELAARKQNGIQPVRPMPVGANPAVDPFSRAINRMQKKGSIF